MKRFITIFFLFLFTTVFSQITVDNSLSAQDLVQLLFNNSGCASISNFSVSGNNSYASFNKNGSNFSFENGIVLSTGFINNVPGPNNSLSDDNLGTPLDNDMNSHFSDTYDTTILEFDFVPLTNYISFEYIFASEEYQENDSNTCDYSDVFAFLIKANSETSYTNIAVIPNTNIPVQVTTVHPDVTNSCQAENEEYFGSWNSPSDPNIPINFNGQTAILKAESNVIVGETYHIKLIIADHTNYRYDSAVFLKAGSFTVGTDLGIDLSRVTNNPLCGNETITLDCGYPAATQYQWYKDNVPYDGNFTIIGGANNQTYTVTSEGKYKVEVDLGNGCVSEGQIIIEYDSLPVVTDTNLIGCNDDFTDFYTFDLSDAVSEITNNDTSLFVENYYHLFNDAENQNGAITNFDNYTNQVINEEIFVRIENQSGCASIAKITLNVFNNPKILGDEDIYYCLNTYPSPITLDSGLLIGNPNDFQYTWLFEDGVNPIINLNNNFPTLDIIKKGVYTVEIESLDGCIVSRKITVTNSDTATITNIIVSETLIRTRVSIKIEVTGEGDYEYAVDNYNFQDSPIFNGLLYGYHIITVKDKNGCLPNAQKEFTILQYPKFFTPNNDGRYDYWNLNNTNSLLVHYNSISNITIYDRFGKVMAIIDPKSNGWNGFYNGKIVFPEDYWFSVDLIDFKGKVTKKIGHFSLVR